ncbi:MAG: HD domain-containing protein [Acidobacteria bacterium]|nr:MAG: HD domain-containing protein [Acidobacteriota bacterium]
MSERLRRQALADELLRRFGAALRGAQLYAPGHPLVNRNIGAFLDIVARVLEAVPSISIAVVGDEVVVGDAPVPRGGSTLGELLGKMKARGIEKVTVDRGVAVDELISLINALTLRIKAPANAPDMTWPELAHVRVGQVKVEQRVETSLADMATIRGLYMKATQAAAGIWQSAGTEGVVNPEEAQTVVKDLAQAVAQNRTALMALTSIRTSDTYTFTHMINVSILTMAQARGLGIDGALLREFGVAGLMHDIGKVRTPGEILTKPDRLDDRETAIMRRHVLDGAEILRRTPDITPLAPIVAFEHHLRADGSGYPVGISRSTQNLATMLTAISDVYDAMRSRRHYQRSFPSERVLAVLQRNEGREFDPNLVRRFVQLMGIYPVGTMVRLNTGALAVVVRAYPLDPYKPRVKVVFAPDARRLEIPYDVDLWDVEPSDRSRPSSVAGPAEPPDPTFDPLTAIS